jgi:hypothetical protein
MAYGMYMDKQCTPNTREDRAMRDTKKADVTLSTGRVVSHRRRTSGAWDAYIADDPESELTDREWTEYCCRVSGQHHPHFGGECISWEDAERISRDGP